MQIYDIYKNHNFEEINKNQVFGYLGRVLGSGAIENASGDRSRQNLRSFDRNQKQML